MAEFAKELAALGDGARRSAIADLLNSAAAAASLTVGASGATSVTTSELLTAADVDELAKRRILYRPPGG